jgi:hypothetical protein
MNCNKLRRNLTVGGRCAILSLLPIEDNVKQAELIVLAAALQQLVRDPNVSKVFTTIEREHIIRAHQAIESASHYLD